MSFGSQTAGDDVVLKFDMHVYTSVVTSEEVKSLVAKYAIPLDLHPCVPPSGLTMNRLPVDKIGSKGKEGSRRHKGYIKLICFWEMITIRVGVD
nr:hypothetical protein [Tanacetum cinerariifolium]